MPLPILKFAMPFFQLTPPRIILNPSLFVSQTMKSTSNAVRLTTAATLLISSFILLGCLRRIGKQTPI
jgi:hypothetical protein